MLPPTASELKQHVLRAAYQVCEKYKPCWYYYVYITLFVRVDRCRVELTPQKIRHHPVSWGWLSDNHCWKYHWTNQESVWEGCRELDRCAKRHNLNCIRGSKVSWIAYHFVKIVMVIAPTEGLYRKIICQQVTYVNIFYCRQRVEETIEEEPWLFTFLFCIKCFLLRWWLLF